MTVYANIAYDRSIWIKVPAGYFPEAPDAEAWGRELSIACWSDSGQLVEQNDLDGLAAILAKFASDLGPGAEHPEHAFDPHMEISTLLYLPDPRGIPFPVRVMVFHEAVVRAQRLTVRELVQVDDQDAIDDPEIADFEHPNFAPGLRVFRHRTGEGQTGPSTGVFAVLKYAFAIPGHDDLLYVSVSWPDLNRIAEARERIDELVRSISFEYHPDPTPEPAPSLARET